MGLNVIATAARASVTQQPPGRAGRDADPRAGPRHERPGEPGGGEDRRHDRGPAADRALDLVGRQQQGVALVLLVPRQPAADQAAHADGLGRGRPHPGPPPSAAARTPARRPAPPAAAAPPHSGEPARRTVGPAAAGRCGRAGSRSSGTAAASTGAKAISPPGVTAVVAPATDQRRGERQHAAGRERRARRRAPPARRRPRPRARAAAPGPAAPTTCANASAAIHGAPRRRPARPRRGSSSRDTSAQHSRPSSVDGSRIHGVDGGDRGPPGVRLVEPAERGLGGVEPAVDVADEPVVAAAADDARDVAVVDGARADDPPQQEQRRDRAVDGPGSPPAGGQQADAPGRCRPVGGRRGRRPAPGARPGRRPRSRASAAWGSSRSGCPR